MSRALGLAACLGLTAIGHPSPAHACDDGPANFTLAAVWPADGATDVPLDGLILLRGPALVLDEPAVTVEQGGLPVDGALAAWTSGIFVWRAAAPFEPGATYHVHITDAATPTDLAFTTGSALAAPPAAPTLTDLALEPYRLDLQECADATPSCYCETWRTVDHEDRMRLRAALSAPPAPFGEFTVAAVELAAAPDLFPADMAHAQPWPTDPLTFDFGLAGTWPSDQVCVRAAAIDPLGRRADGPVTCLDIGDVNTPPPPATTTGCALTPPSSAPLTFILLTTLVHRRRRTPVPKTTST